MLYQLKKLRIHLKFQWDLFRMTLRDRGEATKED